MRITFVSPTVDFGGGIRVIAIYAQELSKLGHTVTIVSTPPHEPISQKLKDLIQGRGWPQSTKEPSHLTGRALNHRVINRQRPVVDSDLPDADVVIATWWQTAEWVNALSPSKGRKFYLVQHHEVFPWLPVERCHATYRLPLKKIVVARWLHEVMRDQYGQPSVVVPNAVDKSQFFAPARARNRIPTIGFLYSDAPFKGSNIAKATIAQIRERVPNLNVMSFGSKKPADVPTNLTFFHQPEQQKIREIYAACDAWLSTSTSEGFNLPAMEAMACRTPVVSTKTGWPAEVIDGTNGILAEVNDVGSLAEGVLSILHAVNWKSFSDRAFQTVSTCSWEKSAKMFERAIQAN